MPAGSLAIYRRLLDTGAAYGHAEAPFTWTDLETEDAAAFSVGGSGYTLAEAGPHLLLYSAGLGGGTGSDPAQALSVVRLDGAALDQGRSSGHAARGASAHQALYLSGGCIIEPATPGQLLNVTSTLVDAGSSLLQLLGGTSALSLLRLDSSWPRIYLSRAAGNFPAATTTYAALQWDGATNPLPGTFVWSGGAPQFVLFGPQGLYLVCACVSFLSLGGSNPCNVEVAFNQNGARIVRSTGAIPGGAGLASVNLVLLVNTAGPNEVCWLDVRMENGNGVQAIPLRLGSSFQAVKLPSSAEAFLLRKPSDAQRADDELVVTCENAERVDSAAFVHEPGPGRVKLAKAGRVLSVGLVDCYRSGGSSTLPLYHRLRHERALAADVLGAPLPKDHSARSNLGWGVPSVEGAICAATVHLGAEAGEYIGLRHDELTGNDDPLATFRGIATTHHGLNLDSLFDARTLYPPPLELWLAFPAGATAIALDAGPAVELELDLPPSTVLIHPSSPAPINYLPPERTTTPPGLAFLHVWLPEGAPPAGGWPSLLVTPLAGWAGGSPPAAFNPATPAHAVFLEALARGVAVVFAGINGQGLEAGSIFWFYPPGHPSGRWEDVNYPVSDEEWWYSVGWIKTQAAYPLDPGAIFALGTSAGACAIAFSALGPDLARATGSPQLRASSKIRGAVLWNPLAWFPAFTPSYNQGISHRWQSQSTGFDASSLGDADPALLDAASPARRILLPGALAATTPILVACDEPAGSTDYSLNPDGTPTLAGALGTGPGGANLHDLWFSALLVDRVRTLFPGIAPRVRFYVGNGHESEMGSLVGSEDGTFTGDVEVSAPMAVAVLDWIEEQLAELVLTPPALELALDLPASALSIAWHPTGATERSYAPQETTSPHPRKVANLFTNPATSPPTSGRPLIVFSNAGRFFEEPPLAVIDSAREILFRWVEQGGAVLSVGTSGIDPPGVPDAAELFGLPGTTRWNDPDVHFPEKDCAQALQFVAEHARELEADLERVYWCGVSSGHEAAAQAILGRWYGFPTLKSRQASRDLRVRGILALAPVAWWEAFVQTVSGAHWPNAGGAPAASLATVAAGVLEASSASKVIREEGARARDVALLLATDDDLESADFSRDVDGDPTLSNALTLTHAGWFAAILRQDLLALPGERNLRSGKLAFSSSANLLGTTEHTDLYSGSIEGHPFADLALAWLEELSSTLFPPPLELALDLPACLVVVPGRLTPPPLELALDLPPALVVVAGPLTLYPWPLELALDLPAPAVLQAVLLPPPLELALDLPAPHVDVELRVQAAALELALDLPPSTVMAGQAPLQPPPLELALDLPAPTLSFALVGQPLELALDFPAGSVSVAVVVAAAALELALDLPAGDVLVAGVLKPPPLELGLDFPAPVLVAPQLIVPPALELLVELPSPVVLVLLDAGPALELALDLPASALALFATPPALELRLDYPADGHVDVPINVAAGAPVELRLDFGGWFSVRSQPDPGGARLPSPASGETNRLHP